MNIRTGLNYGWWKRSPFWAGLTVLTCYILTLILGAGLLFGWFYL